LNGDKSSWLRTLQRIIGFGRIAGGRPGDQPADGYARCVLTRVDVWSKIVAGNARGGFDFQHEPSRKGRAPINKLLDVWRRATANPSESGMTARNLMRPAEGCDRTVLRFTVHARVLKVRFNTSQSEIIKLALSRSVNLGA